MFGLTLNRRSATKTKQEKPFGFLQKRTCVLLVDDNDFNLLIAGTYLENFGYDYDVAKSGPEALEKVRQHEYDAILMDIQMPVMDGLETTRHIRDFETQHRLPRQPIIALTSHPFSGDRESCEISGMDEYISKPFNPDYLKEVIERFMMKEDA